MWVTVLASQPSVSIETLTTQRTCSPSRPLLPTVFITSRSSSLVVDLLDVGAGVALAVLRLEGRDLGGRDLLEVVLHPLAGLELRRVDEDRARPRERLAVDDVDEQRELAGLVGDDLVVLDDLLAGDPVVDELADDGVRADDDEHRRRLAVLRQLLLPVRERLLVASGAGCAARPRAPCGGSQSVTVSFAARFGSWSPT